MTYEFMDGSDAVAHSDAEPPQSMDTMHSATVPEPLIGPHSEGDVLDYSEAWQVVD